MRGGFIVATDQKLFERSVRALTELGGVLAVDSEEDGVVQIPETEGMMFTLFELMPEGTEWEVREGPFTGAPGVSVPDMDSVIACPFECRSPELVARVAGAIARTIEASTWVLDGDGVIWDAEAVDPHELCL